MSKWDIFVDWCNRLYRTCNRITICVLYIVIMTIFATIIFCAKQQKASSNITVSYSRPSYTVTFDPAGGESPSSKTVKLGDNYGDLPVPTKSGYAFVGWSKNLVRNNIIQYYSHFCSTTLIDKNTNKFVFSNFHQSSNVTGELWSTFCIDVSSFVGKQLTISGKLVGLSESGATFRDVYIGQGNTGAYPYHITGSPDSKMICSRDTYSDGLTFSHTVTIIENPSIIGLCIWGNVLTGGGRIDLTIENLQVEVGTTATEFSSSAQPLSPTTQKTCYYDETYCAIWNTNLVNAGSNIQSAGWTGTVTSVDTSTNKYKFAVNGQSYNTDDLYSWVSYFLDMSSYIGKKVTISGTLVGLSENGAQLLDIYVGQGNTGEHRTHIKGSPDSKLVCDRDSYRYGQKFTHTVTIIENPAIIGICIWAQNFQNSGAEVSVIIDNLQIGVYG